MEISLPFLFPLFRHRTIIPRLRSRCNRSQGDSMQLSDSLVESIHSRECGTTSVSGKQRESVVERHDRERLQRACRKDIQERRRGRGWHVSRPDAKFCGETFIWASRNHERGCSGGLFY